MAMTKAELAAAQSLANRLAELERLSTVLADQTKVTLYITFVSDGGQGQITIAPGNSLQPSVVANAVQILGGVISQVSDQLATLGVDPNS